MRETAPLSAGTFDPARLTQARRLGGLTKKALADAVGVTPVAVGQWEAGASPPRPDHLLSVCGELDLPLSFMLAGRPHARLEVSGAHFRSLRSTPGRDRERATAFTEQLWELTHAIERHVELPPVDLPGFSAGELIDGDMPKDPVRAAQELRRYWGMSAGRIPRVVRLLEQHGIVVALNRFAGEQTAKVDAFSTSRLPRPLVVLTPDRADDVYRHRFTACHELGHLVLHGDVEPGDRQQEREADQFAAEFLTPRDEIVPLLPGRMDMNALTKLSSEWGVSVSSLIYRCREVGIISEPTYRRAFQRLNQLTNMGLFQPHPVRDYPGEVPRLLIGAYELGERAGAVSVTELADELCVRPKRVRELLGMPEERPKLELVD